MTKKKHEVTLNVDIQRALDNFSFIRNENVTLLDRDEKGTSHSLCDAVDADAAKFACFWDRHPIEGEIFKCPVRKVYRGDQKTYKSNINGNTYTIRDNLNTSDYYYETDGHFCSAECCMAFLAEEETRDPLFADSRQLITAAIGHEPNCAPHWRVLATYGGTLSIKEFRASFAHKEYIMEEVFSGHFPFCYKFKESYHL